MNRTTILLVGANNFLNSNDKWDVVIALNAEAAIEKFHQLDFDVVVFTNIAEEDTIKLRKLFSFQQPDIILLQNINSEALIAEIKMALEKRQLVNKHTFSVVDDALKAAELPIIIQ
jgi:hypothetical protein